MQKESREMFSDLRIDNRTSQIKSLELIEPSNETVKQSVGVVIVPTGLVKTNIKYIGYWLFIGYSLRPDGEWRKVWELER